MFTACVPAKIVVFITTCPIIRIAFAMSKNDTIQKAIVASKTGLACLRARLSRDDNLLDSKGLLKPSLWYG